MKALLNVILSSTIFINYTIAQPHWPFYRVPVPFEFSEELSVNDVNLDGYPDLITGNYITRYKNDGAGNFELQIADHSPNARAKNLEGADIDSDGDIDLVGNLGSNANNALVVYENIGSEVFVKRVIQTGLVNGPYTYLHDLDRDGDVDIMSNTYDSSNPVWIFFENIGNLNFTAKTIYQGTVAYHNLIIEDFDRDDDPDIMALGTELVLFENDGQENFSVRNTVAVNIDQSDRYASGDIDDDGDTDVLVTRSSSPQELILYVNGGFASFDEVIINNLPTSINDIEICKSSKSPGVICL